MSTEAKCAKCGTPLPAGLLGGNCPNCLLQLALSPAADSRMTTEAPPAPGAIPCAPGAPLEETAQLPTQPISRSPQNHLPLSGRSKN